MKYNLKINVHSIPITAIWGDSQWCKASDVIHLSRGFCAMYHVLQSIKDKEHINNHDAILIDDAIRIASEVIV